MIYTAHRNVGLGKPIETMDIEAETPEDALVFFAMETGIKEGESITVYINNADKYHTPSIHHVWRDYDGNIKTEPSDTPFA